VFDVIAGALCMRQRGVRCWRGKLWGVLQYGKESSAQGNKICLSNDIDEGVSNCSGKGMLKTLLWVWKIKLKKARFELDRILRKILEGLKALGYSLKFRPIRKAFLVGRFEGRMAWALGPSPIHVLVPNPLQLWVLG
jgi:hypothetical protein